MERKDSFVFWNSKYRGGIFLKKRQNGLMSLKVDGFIGLYVNG